MGLPVSMSHFHAVVRPKTGTSSEIPQAKLALGLFSLYTFLWPLETSQSTYDAGETVRRLALIIRVL